MPFIESLALVQEIQSEDVWRKYQPEVQRYRKKKTKKKKRKIMRGKKSQGFPIGTAFVAIIVIICVGVGVWWITNAGLIPAPSNGGGNTDEPTNTAPNFTVTDIYDNSFSLRNFSGQVVVLDLMGTTCIPCLQEIEELKTVDAAYGNEVQIISISVTGDTDEALRQFVEDHDLTWLVARDTDNVGTKYGIRYIPTIFVIDQRQNIAHQHFGFVDAHTLMNEIDTLPEHSLLIRSIQILEEPKVRGCEKK